MRQINLSGIWKATEDLGIQSKAGKPGFDASSWRSLSVPGHWQEAPGLERFTGRLLYRRAFTFDETLAPGEAARLRFDGIFYEAKIWLNGAFVGEQKGYFAPHQYDVTKHLRPGENVVMVEVDAPEEANRHAKRMIAGTFTDWACKAPGAEPGGIWRDVSLEIYHGVVPERFTFQVEPDRLPAAPTSPDEPVSNEMPAAPDEAISAALRFELEFAAVAEGSLSWRAIIQPESFVGEPITIDGDQPVRRGWNQLQGAMRIADARLWWTWDHGRPDLYRLTLELSHGGGPVQKIERLFGVRKVELRKHFVYLNGRRIFIRGTNYGPADIRLARVKREAYQQDLDLMIQANMNTARIYGHIGKPELYEEASRKGILLWQDFPLHGLYSRAIMDDARQQARAMVDTLGHWPAIGLWCCHGDPVRNIDQDDPSVLDRSLAALSAMPGSWNRSSLAPALRGAIRQMDRSRPCLAHPGELGPSDLYYGWYQGQVEGLAKLLKSSPGAARFVAEFGSQSFPNVANSRKFVKGTWPNLNWSDLAERYLLQPKRMERYIPHPLARNFDEYVEATQGYQARLHKFFIEQLRRRKYKQTSGILQFLLTDSSPGVTWSIVDYWRAPKLAYGAVQEAYRPVYIMADWPEPGYGPGARIALQLFLVNDRYERYQGAWRWSIEREGEQLATGDGPALLPEDSFVLVPAGVEWVVPESTAPGPAEVVLTLDLDGQEPIVNRYRFGILPPG